MKSTLRATMIIGPALAASLALAQQPSPPPAVPPAIPDRPKTLTTEKALAIYGALQSLGAGGAPKLSSLATFALATDIGLLEPVVKAYQAAVKSESAKILADHPADAAATGQPNDAGFKIGSSGEMAMVEAMQPVLQADAKVDLSHIKLADLNIGSDPAKNNQIAPATLSTLLPIIDQ